MLPRSNWALLLATASSSASAASTSPKRGLVFTPNSRWPSDNQIWTNQTDLTWYYNYGAQPSPAFASIPQDKFEFVPMLWGLPDDGDTSFVTTVKSLINDKKLKITHVMTFNEPDGKLEWGSADIPPNLAAKAYVKNALPLAEMGIKIGLPACTGGWGGLPWLTEFVGNCSLLISTDKEPKNCTWDFLPLHWYENLGGLKSHIAERQAAFPGTPIWITEYNLHNQDEATTQDFYTQSADFLDSNSIIERYSLFGAFRSSVSNVGPNGAMLSEGGKLTQIGVSYLGLDGKVEPVSPGDRTVRPGSSLASGRPRIADSAATLGVAVAVAFALFAGW